MRIAFIGLPGSGKSTVFQALHGSHSQPSAAPHGGGRVQLASVKALDANVEHLAAIFKPKKTTHASIEFADVEGSVLGGEQKGRGDQVLATYQNMEALAHVVHAFESEVVPHPAGSVDPGRDLADLNTELVLTDLQVVERRLERIETRSSKGDKTVEREELDLLRRCRQALEEGTPLRQLALTEHEQRRQRGFGFLTSKPQVVVLNIDEEQQQENRAAAGANLEPLLTSRDALCVLCAKLEMELSQLEPEDAAVFMAELGIAQAATATLLRASIEALGLLSFYTVGDDEVKAWLLAQGSTAPRAGGAIHSDLERGFIRAEVVSCQDLLDVGSLAAARKQGLLRVEGKDYIVANGDVITIRFNV